MVCCASTVASANKPVQKQLTGSKLLSMLHLLAHLHYIGGTKLLTT
jgi:hypothetical protein